jgi:glyoxylase-like metal-dependent hydrolase (beta-lactamase superfamily II)
LTHGHHDHFCGTWGQSRQKPNFPNARHLLSLHDWDKDTLTKAAQHADGAAADPRPLEALHRLGLLSFDINSVSLPPEITLHDAPGETHGHRVVQITSRNQTFYFLADLFHVLAELDTPQLCPKWVNTDLLLQSRAQFAEDIKQSNARFMCSHISKVFSVNDLRHNKP